MRTFCSLVWTGKVPEELLQNIVDFKSIFQTFGKYQVSQFGNEEWHCLDHVCKCNLQ